MSDLGMGVVPRTIDAGVGPVEVDVGIEIDAAHHRVDIDVTLVVARRVGAAVSDLGERVVRVSGGEADTAPGGDDVDVPLESVSEVVAVVVDGEERQTRSVQVAEDVEVVRLIPVAQARRVIAIRGDVVAEVAVGVVTTVTDHGKVVPGRIVATPGHEILLDTGVEIHAAGSGPDIDITLLVTVDVAAPVSDHREVLASIAPLLEVLVLVTAPVQDIHMSAPRDVFAPSLGVTAIETDLSTCRHARLVGDPAKISDQPVTAVADHRVAALLVGVAAVGCSAGLEDHVSCGRIDRDAAEVVAVRADTPVTDLGIHAVATLAARQEIDVAGIRDHPDRSVVTRGQVERIVRVVIMPVVGVGIVAAVSDLGVGVVDVVETAVRAAVRYRILLSVVDRVRNTVDVAVSTEVEGNREIVDDTVTGAESNATIRFHVDVAGVVLPGLGHGIIPSVSDLDKGALVVAAHSDDGTSGSVEGTRAGGGGGVPTRIDLDVPGMTGIQGTFRMHHCLAAIGIAGGQ